MRTYACPQIEDWLASNLPASGRVGIDPFLHTVDGVRRLQRKVEVRVRMCLRVCCVHVNACVL